MRSSSGRAASHGPSALCRAMPPTGHAPTLCGTTAVSRTCATQPPRCGRSPAPYSPPCSSLQPASPGEAPSSAGFKPICSLQPRTLPPSSPPSRPLHLRYAQEPDSVENSDSQPHTFPDPSQGLVPVGTTLAWIGTCPEPRLINNICSRSFVFSRCPRLMPYLSSRSWSR